MTYLAEEVRETGMHRSVFPFSVMPVSYFYCLFFFGTKEYLRLQSKTRQERFFLLQVQLKPENTDDNNLYTKLLSFLLKSLNVKLNESNLKIALHGRYTPALIL